MPKCSVLGCGSRKSENQKCLSLHRLPRSDYIKKKWLEVIGTENIRPHIKDIFICSLHFEENCFNRTLDVVRLRDDAVPSKRLLPRQNQDDSAILADLKPETTFPMVESNVPNLRSKLQLAADSQDVDIGPHPVPGPSGAPTTMEQTQKVKQLENKCDSLRRKIKRLNEKVRRQKKKIANFRNIIKDLQERNLVNNDSSIVLEACVGPKDFLKRQILKSQGLPLEKQYSEETRKFALTLHFFSPKAYDFVRRTYNTCLPHPRTLTSWYQQVNAEPGLCEEAFSTLKAKVQSSDSPVICALMFDEMSIRKSLCWDAQTKTYRGRVTMGTDCDNDSLEVANQCLVFLLNCINGGWKLPIGYFFITSLTGEQKSELLKMCIQKCEEVGVKVVSVTCDGPAANFSMFSEFGCKLSTNQDDTTFNCGQSTLHAFVDPCHAIKLIRNTFGDLRVLYDMNGRKIDFKY